MPYSVPETEQILWAEGFVRNPFACLKTRDGTPEVGSWVYRDSPLAPRQLHVMLFRGEGEATDVYAHEEPSSVNPFRGFVHVTGSEQMVGTGVERIHQMLPGMTSRVQREPNSNTNAYRTGSTTVGQYGYTRPRY